MTTMVQLADGTQEDEPRLLLELQCSGCWEVYDG